MFALVKTRVHTYGIACGLHIVKHGSVNGPDIPVYTVVSGSTLQKGNCLSLSDFNLLADHMNVVQNIADNTGCSFC